MTCPYMSAPWFALLRQRCEGAVQTHIARQLGISATTLNMVLNGTGPYGSGAAKTAVQTTAARETVMVRRDRAMICPTCSRRRGAKGTIRSIRLKNSGRKNRRAALS